MRIVFFGTSQFAVPALEALAGSRHEVLALVTQPDRQRGRNLKLAAPPAKAAALDKRIPVYQPQNASSRESVEYLKKLNADLFVVVSFGQILKKEALEIPRLYCLNLHGSLLPKYRGAAPTNWAIINGDTITGVTVQKMSERMDEGAIMLQVELPIKIDDTNVTISEKLSALGAELLLKALDAIEDGKGAFTPQDSSRATYAPKLKKPDGLIDWNENAARIRDKVRGMLPWPGAYTRYNGRILKILQASVSEATSDVRAKAGEVVEVVKDKGIVVRTGSGELAIRSIQLEGKKILDSDSFVRGHRIAEGDIFQ